MTTLPCDDVDALLGAFILRALPDQERLAVERHLANCRQHHGEIEQLERSSSMLSLAAKAREPRPELRTRILAAVRAESDPALVSLGWNSERLPVGSHVCAFHSDDQRLKRTMAFLRAGLDQPADLGVLFADRRRIDTLLGSLQEGYHGSIDSLIERGKLVLVEGAPGVEELVERITDRFDRGLRDGYRLIRLLGFIGWNQPGWPDLTSLVEFETGVNQLVRSYPAVVVCTYDVLRLPGLSLIEGGLKRHPITILNDQIVQRNPFYVAA